MLEVSVTVTVTVPVTVTVTVTVGYIINRCDKKWHGVFLMHHR